MRGFVSGGYKTLKNHQGDLSNEVHNNNSIYSRICCLILYRFLSSDHVHLSLHLSVCLSVCILTCDEISQFGSIYNLQSMFTLYYRFPHLTELWLRSVDSVIFSEYSKVVFNFTM